MLTQETKNLITFLQSCLSLVRDSVLVLIAFLAATISILGGHPDKLSESDWLKLVAAALSVLVLPVIGYAFVKLLNKLSQPMTKYAEFVMGRMPNVPRGPYLFFYHKIGRMTLRSYVKKMKKTRAVARYEQKLLRVLLFVNRGFDLGFGVLYPILFLIAGIIIFYKTILKYV